MNSQDILYYVLTIGFIILVGFISLLTYEAILALRLFRSMLHRLENITSNVQDLTFDVTNLKNQLKIGSMAIVSNILQYILGRKKKGGEE